MLDGRSYLAAKSHARNRLTGHSVLRIIEARSTAMFCPKCGLQNADETKFCRGCGADLGSVLAVVEGKLSSTRALSEQYIDLNSRGIRGVLIGLGFAFISWVVYTIPPGNGHHVDAFSRVRVHLPRDRHFPPRPGREDQGVDRERRTRRTPARPDRLHRASTFDLRNGRSRRNAALASPNTRQPTSKSTPKTS